MVYTLIGPPPREPRPVRHLESRPFVDTLVLEGVVLYCVGGCEGTWLEGRIEVGPGAAVAGTILTGVLNGAWVFDPAACQAVSHGSNDRLYTVPWDAEAVPPLAYLMVGRADDGRRGPCFSVALRAHPGEAPR